MGLLVHFHVHDVDFQLCLELHHGWHVVRYIAGESHVQSREEAWFAQEHNGYQCRDSR